MATQLQNVSHDGTTHAFVPVVSTAALIVAAGRGMRLGGERPKAYVDLGGVPLVRHSLDALAAHPAIGPVGVVIHPDDAPHYQDAVRGLDILPPIAGGATRQDSVRAGLESLTAVAPDRVLIHDAARPFADGPLIDRVLGALDDAPGAIPGLPVWDSLKRAPTGWIEATLEGGDVWRAQTPQGFAFDQILRAYRAAAADVGLSDDAEVARRAGIAVRLVAGSEGNVKITSAEDLARAERFLLDPLGDVRCGTGFDIHRFGLGPAGEGRLRLCGVDVAYPRHLVGHSDADVGLHALTDAVLGAIGAGDIGTHFPPGDARWRDADSAAFVQHAAALVAARRGRIAHVDITLICESPKIAPYRTAMIERIAELLDIVATRVSVKATTTERLGFAGRGEGIAAQATATVRLPA